MKIKYFLTAILLIISQTLFSSFSIQSNEIKDIIYWNISTLDWSDFKGKPDSSSPLQALTTSHVEANTNYSGDTAEFYIAASFEKNASWVKPDKETPELLKHEQVHFDIAELHARKLRKMVQASLYSVKTINKEFSDLCSKVISDFHVMEEVYDRETNHSADKQQQAAWERNIAAQLKALDAYSLAAIKVHINIK